MLLMFLLLALSLVSNAIILSVVLRTKKFKGVKKIQSLKFMSFCLSPYASEWLSPLQEDLQA